ncbi:helix-turn-helix domain-containing protein [Chachezhania antarctica]|uniref:helix-turn-helix domain-containing protein n=1 Tax=Chachezhania antarctica TaxID=2340860 RepID=UPI000EAECABF|nr:AraC family transcriptional regulator [Chachezhania antarctica]
MTTALLSPRPCSLTRNGEDLRAALGAASTVEHAGPGSVRLRLAPPAGTGTIEFFEFDPSFTMILSDCFWETSGTLNYAGEDWIRFNFCFDAHAVFDFGHAGRFDLIGQELRYFHQPAGVLCGHVIQGGARSVCTTISIKRAYLERICGLDATGDAEAGLPADTSGFFFRRHEMSAACIRAAADLLAMTHEGPLRLLYARAKAEELLVSALAASERSISGGCIALSARDLVRLTEVRQCLEANLSRTPPVAELSRRFAMNRTKLAYGFRQLHGCTMREFISRTRLETAMTLLRDADLSIDQIAAEVGFSHASSFSAAFKKRYRVSPRRFRGSRRPVSRP